jgi:DNA modification methylase
MEINKIYLGNAYELIKQVPDKSIDLIVTDPPYDFGSGSGAGAFGTKKRSHEEVKVASLIKMRSDTTKCEENLVQGIDPSILNEFVRVMKKINCYIWCNKEQIYDYMTFFVKERKCNFDLITWHKTNPIPTCNNNYLHDTEYCLFFREEGVQLSGNMQTLKKWYSTVCNKADKELYGHPTIKPIGIISNLIINSSDEGSLVLDPFIGSGTTAVACKLLGRNYLGFEINQAYYAIAVDRLNGVSQIDRRNGYTQGRLF